MSEDERANLSPELVAKLKQGLITGILSKEFPPMSRAPTPLSPLRGGASFDREEMERKRTDHFSRVDKRRATLNALPFSEVQAISQKLVEDEQRKRDIQASLEEKGRPFNQTKAKADFAYWIKFDTWSMDEAVALLMGRDPRHVTWGEVATYINISAFAQKYADLRMLVERAEILTQQGPRVAPSVVVHWAESKGIAVPAELLSVKRASSNDLQQRKRPPTPINPVKGNFLPPTRRLDDGCPADWDTWSDIPEVEVWKAVALSLDHEPERLPGLDLRPAWGSSFDDCPQEFQRRLTIAEAAANAGTLRVSRISMGYPAPYQKVDLSIFCAWTQGLRKPWQLPDAMLELEQHSEIEAEQPRQDTQAARQEAEQNTRVTTVDSSDRSPTVKEAIAEYVALVMSANPSYTADDLYSHMRREAGSDASPFSRLAAGDELFCTEASAPCGLASVRAALTAYRKAKRSDTLNPISTVEAPSNR